MRVADKVLPDFICPGAPGAGTTALWSHLRQCDGIFLPARIKETNFLFARHYRNIFEANNFDTSSSILSLNEYSSLYEPCEAQLCGDISPLYMYFPVDVIKSIMELYGKERCRLKVIILLRNPMYRAWSHYKMLKYHFKFEDLSFVDAIHPHTIARRLKNGPFGTVKNVPAYNFDYLGHSRYAEALATFLSEFPENVRSIVYEDFTDNPRAIVDSVLRFLGTSCDLRNVDLQSRYGRKGRIKHQRIYRFITQPNPIKDVVKRLVPYRRWGELRRFASDLPLFVEDVAMDTDDYRTCCHLLRDDIAATERLLDRKLPHWTA